MARKTGLGKGLDSLIPDTVKDSPEGKIKIVEKPAEVKVKISKVGPSREQPRKQFDEESLAELAESIKQFGVIQPLIVQEKNGFYEIIAGERRWRAAKMAGLKEVPVIIKEYSELEAVEISLIENIQRENLNPIEEAEAYRRLIDEFNLKQEEIAERVSKSRSAVTNSMRLLKLGGGVQAMVVDGRLSTGHARALLGIEDPKKQEEAASKVFNENLSVRETEKLVKKIQSGKAGSEDKKPERAKDAVTLALEEQLKTAVGTKVSIKQKSGGSGRIEIEFYSKDDLERIYDIIIAGGKA